MPTISCNTKSVEMFDCRNDNKQFIHYSNCALDSIDLYFCDKNNSALQDSRQLFVGFIGLTQGNMNNE